MNTNKLLRAFFFMVVMTLMALSNSALAAKPMCGDKTCKGNETAASCPVDCDVGAGGGGGTDPDPVSLVVYWNGNIFEPQDRTCEPNNFTPNGNTGNYHCGLSVNNSVTFNFGYPGVQTARKGDANLCIDVFNGKEVILTPDSSYQFYWFGPCSDTCDIEIYNWFGGEQVSLITADQADFVRVTAWAVAKEPFGNSNPFVEERTLNIDKIEFSFYANGSNKKLATCEYSQVESNLSTDDVTFNTSVLPE